MSLSRKVGAEIFCCHLLLFWGLPNFEKSRLFLKIEAFYMGV
jgi:hypothetical protein